MKVKHLLDKYPKARIKPSIDIPYVFQYGRRTKCMEKAREACTREESMSWIKPGTKILAKWCQDAEKEGGSKDILRLLFSLYKSSCKDILEEKEDSE